MRVCRATRHLAKRNFTLRGLSKRVAALHYFPSVVTTSINNHSVDPVILEHLIRDMVACESLSFAGQVAIILLNGYLKNVQRNIRITCDEDICEVIYDDNPD